MGEAARDYRRLMDRGYPVTASVKLVGDRWRLGAEERAALFRGVASASESAARRGRLAIPGATDLVLLDAYNVAFTVLHYLVGKPCFLSSDGFLRDAGGNHGRVSRDELLARAFGELAAFLASRVARVEAFLDAPVPRSGTHASVLRAAFGSAGLEGEVTVVPSADGAILARLAGGEGRRTIVASSDSVLVARSALAWDAARGLLEHAYGAVFPDFGALLSGEAMDGTPRGPGDGA